MKPEHVTVEETRKGLKIFVQDDDTDTLVIYELYYLDPGNVDQHLCSSTVVRGNYSGSTRYGAPKAIVRRPVRANVYVEAPPVEPQEMERRKRAAFAAAAFEKGKGNE